MNKEGYDPKCFHTCPDCDYRCNCGDIPCSHCLLFIATEEDGSQWVKYEDYEKLMKYEKRWEKIDECSKEMMKLGKSQNNQALIFTAGVMQHNIRKIEKELNK